MRIYLYLLILSMITFVACRDGYNEKAHLQKDYDQSETLMSNNQYQFDNLVDDMICFDYFVESNNSVLSVSHSYDILMPTPPMFNTIRCKIVKPPVEESKAAFLCSAVLKPPKIESQMLRTNKKLLKKTLSKLFYNIKYLKVKNDKIILKTHIFGLRSKVFSINEVLTSLIPSHLDCKNAKKLYENTVVSSVRDNKLDDAVKDCVSIIETQSINRSYVNVCKKSNNTSTSNELSSRPLKEPDKSIESVATVVESTIQVGKGGVVAIIKGLEGKLDSHFRLILRHNPVLTG